MACGPWLWGVACKSSGQVSVLCLYSGLICAIDCYVLCHCVEHTQCWNYCMTETWEVIMWPATMVLLCCCFLRYICLVWCFCPLTKKLMLIIFGTNYVFILNDLSSSRNRKENEYLTNNKYHELIKVLTNWIMKEEIV